MREQLAITLAQFPNTKIVDGTAEATTLPEHSIDVITCAQALNHFDIDAFRIECNRISKPNSIVISLNSYTRNDLRGNARYKKSTSSLFKNPVVQEFPNTVLFTRDKWLQYLSSMIVLPQESDLEYEAHLAEMSKIFDRDNVDGLLRYDLITKMYSEKLFK